MANKKQVNKKGGFALAPITLSEPVKVTDGFTNLVETPAPKIEESVKPQQQKKTSDVPTGKPKAKRGVEKEAAKPAAPSDSARRDEARNERSTGVKNSQSEKIEKHAPDLVLTESELLRILDADNLDEIYELTDVLRASSLKLYATLIRLADSRGRARVKNHELMSKAGIKGIATLYKQERWLMDLKLLEKKAKPGPHDGSSYVVHRLESLPLPSEIYEKFDEYMSKLK